MPSRLLNALLTAALLAACTDPPPSDLVCGEGDVLDGERCVPESCGVGSWGHNGDLEAVFAAPSPLGDRDGDGSRDAPFDRVEVAMDTSFTAGHGVVVLADGRYLESISFGRRGDGVRLVGRCPELTILDGGGGPEATMTVHADGVQLTALTITGGAPGIAVLPSSPGGVARLSATNIVLVDNSLAGIVVSGMGDVEADLRDSRITATEPRSDGAEAHGALVEGSGLLTLVSVDVVANVGFGVTARGADSVAVLDGVDVTRTGAYRDGRPGSALRAVEAGTILGQRVVVEDTVGVGVWSSGDSSLVDLTASGILSMSPGVGGDAVRADDGGRVALSAVIVLGARGAGLRGVGPGSQIILSDVSVSEGVSLDSRRGSEAVRLSDGATMSATTTVFGAGPGPAIVLESGHLQCSDCEVRDREFAGIVASPGSTLRLTRGAVTATRVSESLGGGVGILVLGDAIGGPVVEIVETGLQDHAGPALLIQGPSTVLVAGASIERCGSGGSALARAGLIARDGTERWTGTVGAPGARGLWLREVLFRDIGGDAVLLHAASATLDANTFEDIGETPLRTQACTGIVVPELVGAQPASNECEGPLRDVGPVLQHPGG
jgi:hypothetical protein